MNVKIHCCNNCIHRHVGCHGHCLVYAAAVRENELVMAKNKYLYSVNRMRTQPAPAGFNRKNTLREQQDE